MIGAAGISAFPMSSRVIHKMGLKEDPQNFLLMHTVGVNVSGQIASVIAGGLIMSLVYHWVRRDDHAAAADPHRRCRNSRSGRPATWQESLRLMAPAGSSIFIVILVIMLCVYLLNRIFRSKDPK